MHSSLVLSSGMRVLYKGEQYNLIEMGGYITFDEETNKLRAIQTFFISKVEPSTLEDLITVYEVASSEITQLIGNDYFLTSPYNIGITNFLGGIEQ